MLEPKLAALMPERRNVPLIWLGLYATPVEMTSAEVEHWLATHTAQRLLQLHQRDARLGRGGISEALQAGAGEDPRRRHLSAQPDVQGALHAEGSPLTFFLDLRQKQRVAYGGIVDTGKVTVLSASPELFIEQDGRIDRDAAR